MCNVASVSIEYVSVYLKAVGQEHSMMQIVWMIVMLVSAFVIYATLHMMVVQKIKDIGILAAVGGAPRDIGSVFLMTGTVVGVTGSLLGVIAGLLSSIWINPVNDWVYANFEIELFPRETFDLDGIPCHLDPAWVVAVTVDAIALSAVSAHILKVLLVLGRVEGEGEGGGEQGEGGGDRRGDVHAGHRVQARGARRFAPRHLCPVRARHEQADRCRGSLGGMPRHAWPAGA